MPASPTTQSHTVQYSKYNRTHQLVSTAKLASDGCHGDGSRTPVVQGQTYAELPPGVPGTVLVSQNIADSGNLCLESIPVHQLFANIKLILANKFHY